MTYFHDNQQYTKRLKTAIFANLLFFINDIDICEDFKTNKQLIIANLRKKVIEKRLFLKNKKATFAKILRKES